MRAARALSPTQPLSTDAVCCPRGNPAFSYASKPEEEQRTSPGPNAFQALKEWGSGHSRVVVTPVSMQDYGWRPPSRCVKW